MMILCNRVRAVFGKKVAFFVCSDIKVSTCIGQKRTGEIRFGMLPMTIVKKQLVELLGELVGQ